MGISYGPVSVSVISQCSIEKGGWIELVFSTETSFDKCYAVLQGNSGIYNNEGTSIWNFVLNSSLRKFRHGISIVET